MIVEWIYGAACELKGEARLEDACFEVSLFWRQAVPSRLVCRGFVLISVQLSKHV